MNVSCTLSEVDCDSDKKFTQFPRARRSQTSRQFLNRLLQTLSRKNTLKNDMKAMFEICCT